MARLLIGLESMEDSAYDVEYYNKLQGVVYNCLRDTHPGLHDKKGYKFFCFSNIFPVKDPKRGDECNLIISSPDYSIIKTLSDSIQDEINVGNSRFRILSKRLINIKLNDRCTLKTPTPIVVRIPKSRYLEYGISSEKEYVYWRHQYTVSAFLKQLEENLHKKYTQFTGVEVKTPLLFEEITPLKTVAVYATINNVRTQIIGSTWEFHLNHLTQEQKTLLEFGIDCGFGELNTLGFGFINPTKNA